MIYTVDNRRKFNFFTCSRYLFSSHTYAWDVEGKPVTIDSVGLTYNAQGRMVEQNRSGSYTQIVYGPGGGKLALMSGQTLAKGFVPLSGGATAVYNSNGLAYYRHADWLGSSRLASLPSGTTRLYYDGAYAPYGENYAETGTQDRNFTGQNQDTVNSGAYPLYDFLYRQHHPVWGRWLSPDPAGLGAVDPTNPQSWNRYAYVTNNPLALTDSLGLHGFKIYAPGCDPALCVGGSSGGGPGYVSTPCNPDTDPGCVQPPPPCDPFMDPFCWPDPGWGGGGGGGGGGGQPSGTGTATGGPVEIWSTNDLPSELPEGSLPCDFGVCGGPTWGASFQAEEVFNPLAWELIKDIGAAILGGLAAWQHAQQTSRLVTVTCSCHIVDLTTGRGGDVGIAKGVGVGSTYATARAAAYQSAIQDARRQLGRSSGFYLRHCQYSQQ
jgi:RHS repeat-associated protein